MTCYLCDIVVVRRNVFTLHPECRFVMDRDENSAVNILKRYLAWLGPHTGDPVRCADVFTAIDDVNTFRKAQYDVSTSSSPSRWLISCGTGTTCCCTPCKGFWR